MISTFASHAIMDYILGRAPFARPINFKLDLSASPLGADGAGLIKPADPAYAAIVIPNTKTNFSSAANKAVTLINEFVFNQSTVDWAPVVNYSISDESGNVWFFGELDNAPVHIQIDSSAIVDAGVNRFKLDICGGSSSDMAITTAKANMILDYVLGGVPFTVPSSYYLGVSMTPVSPEGIGATEPSAPGYARVELPNNKNTFTAASNYAVTLAKQFKFPSAQTEWGNFTHFFISESPTGENVWWCGKLTYARLVEIATTLVINPDSFNWVLGNCA